ncbi:MAG: ABC transporter permease [Actinobacteria bacterium]|nr:MAG: ABC transporter permease [Actinomycetota bacterium]
MLGQQQRHRQPRGTGSAHEYRDGPRCCGAHSERLRLPRRAGTTLRHSTRPERWHGSAIVSSHPLPRCRTERHRGDFGHGSSRDGNAPRQTALRLADRGGRAAGVPRPAAVHPVQRPRQLPRRGAAGPADPGAGLRRLGPRQHRGKQARPWRRGAGRRRPRGRLGRWHRNLHHQRCHRRGSTHRGAGLRLRGRRARSTLRLVQRTPPYRPRRDGHRRRWRGHRRHDHASAGGTALTVVGTIRGAQFNALPTAYVTLPTYDQAIAAANPGLPFVPINAVAFDVVDGQDVAAVAASIAGAVAGVTAYPLDTAVSLIPGIDSITQSFGILVGLTFVIGIVVIGFFFLILTVQKMRAFTLLRAIGTSTGRLAGSVALQIAVVVLVASAIAVVLTLLAVQGLNTGIPVTLQPSLIIGTVLAVLVFSLLAGLLSIRRIARIDPATAVGAR